MKKFTKKQMFEVVKSNTAVMTLPDEMTVEDMIAFIDREIEILSKPSAQTPQQKENVEIKAQMVEAIRSAGNPLTVAEIISRLNVEIASQRASALLSQLVKAEEISRIEPKGKEKVKFTVA